MADQAWSTAVKAALERNNITELFAVQKLVVPRLRWNPADTAKSEPAVPGYYDAAVKTYQCSKPAPGAPRARDVLVNAPTGSGKTLCYVLPVIEALHGRRVPRVQCLVVLPTRELVRQVHAVFESFCQGTALHVAALSGAASFAAEQALLVRPDPRDERVWVPRADIVVATPGRLLDHLDQTPAFHLGHLRWLVLDEADRLLAQEYHDWLARILHPDPTAKSVAAADSWAAPVAARAPPVRPPLLKVLFSATLEASSPRLAPLELYKPLFLHLGATETPQGEAVAAALPESLEQQYIVLRTPSERPVLLLDMLVEQRLGGVLVFVHSQEAAQRLALLLATALDEVGGSIRVGLIASTLSSAKRAALLDDFTAGRVSVLVATDLLARGIDVEAVRTVVNYDVPATQAAYVHRVGRTARAGRDGVAVTLLAPTQVRFFRRLTKGLHPAGRLDRRSVSRHSDSFRKLEAAAKSATAKASVKIRGG